MKKALIVDDNEQNLYLLQTLLKSQGYDVLMASNGAEALEQARRGPPDIIISDILMPVMDGFALCREWRKDERLQLIPFIFYTATYTDTKDEELALSLGAARFVVKPQAPEEFVALVRQVVEGRETGRPIAPVLPAPEEEDYYRLYSEALVRKLEDKMLALEEINRALEQEITVRKRAEEAIQESEERFRTVFERSTVGKSLTAPDGKLLQINKAFADMLGYTIEEIQELNFAQLTHPDDVAEGRECIRILLAGEQTICRFEKRYIHKSGNVVWVDLSTTLLRNGNGTPLYLITSILDITKRKRAEEALKESEEKHRTLFESSRDAIMTLAPPSWGFTTGNPATVEIFAVNDEAAFIALGPWELSPEFQPDGRPSSEKAIDMIQTAMAKGSHFFEWTHRRLGGESFPATVVLTRMEIGGQALLQATVRDITERKRAEEELQHTLERLRKAVGTTIQVMVSTVETRDPYTSGHQTRSANLARAIAAEMGLSQENIDGIRMAGSIHDIGKLSIPAEILSKPTKLSALEFSLIKEHAQKGYEILKNVESSWPLAEIVFQHHERMDGSGYPRNLKGDDILVEARILAVADVVEAMASHRPYRPALGIDAALAEIEKNKGILYDADAADVCLRLFREKRYELQQ